MDFPSRLDLFIAELKHIQNSDLNMIHKTGNAVKLCRQVLSEFKIEISKVAFDSIEDEITFFKKFKSIPLSNLIYFLEVNTFEMEFPRISKKRQKIFIKKSKNKMDRFFNRHIDFVNYIDLEQMHLDVYYFTRLHSNNKPEISSQDYFFDLNFNTSHDLLLAKLIAYKRFIEYLEKRLNNKNIGLEFEELNKLKWTSSKVALTELIYALYHSRVINYGNSDIKDIAMVLQNSFNFELGDFYKTYSDIRGRKNDRTKFLDELSMALTSEMERRDS